MNGGSFEEGEWKMEELKTFFFNTLLLWTASIDLNGLNLHGFHVLFSLCN